MTNIKFPFGSSETIALTATGAQAVSITDSLTIIDGVTVPATGNRTLNLTVDSSVPTGSQIFIKSKTAGTETLTFGTAILGVTLTGVTGKIFGIWCIYDGTNFIESGTGTPI